MERRHRRPRYGLFVAGLLVAAAGFLVSLGNAMAMEGASGSLALAGALGVVGGSLGAGVGILVGASRPARLAAVLVGGLAGAAAGWLLGSLMFSGGRFYLEWMMAVCFAPLGMWLGLLAGAGKAE